MKQALYLLASVLLFSQSFAGSNIFLSEAMRAAVCDELISEMVESSEQYTDMMSRCMDAEQTTFCTPSIKIESNVISDRGFVEYNIVGFQPTSDSEVTSYSVKAYPDSGLFLRQKASHDTCE